MTTYIALLRAVNVAGNAMVAMADLRQLLTDLGFEDARSLLQSGNLVFRGDRRAAPALEHMLESEVEKLIDLKTAVFVRTAQEWEAVVARNPFPDETKRDPARLLMLALKDAVSPRNVEALQAAITGPEIVRGAGREAYIVYPAGVGRSRVTTALIEKKLGTRVTGRNWNTVLKLAALTTP